DAGVRRVAERPQDSGAVGLRPAAGPGGAGAMRRAALVAAYLLGVYLLAFGPSALAASSKDLSEGRRHLHKANALAADAKCDAAVREYTFAYQKLHDPVVLFNRAECYRRLGQNDAAVSDYRAFLDAVPRAPNRAEVEA